MTWHSAVGTAGACEGCRSIPRSIVYDFLRWSHHYYEIADPKQRKPAFPALAVPLARALGHSAIGAYRG